MANREKMRSLAKKWDLTSDQRKKKGSEDSLHKTEMPPSKSAFQLTKQDLITQTKFEVDEIMI